MSKKIIPMNQRRLTPAQKEILQTLKDNPEAYIYEGWGHSYKLCYGDSLRSIQIDTMMFLRHYWLQKHPKSRPGSEKYTIKPDAEISDAWKDRENQRQAEESARKQADKEAAIQAEREDSEARNKRLLEAIRGGQVDGVAWWGGIQLEFEGQKYHVGKSDYNLTVEE